MNKVAFVFPGQGSQSVGMLDELIIYPEVAESFMIANEVLHIDLLDMVNNGPVDELNKTQWTQPALLAASVGLFHAVQARKSMTVDIMAGHSLGEYSALVCAGSLSFEAAVSLVHKRGLFMQESVPSGTGSMAAVLGLDAELVEDACSRAHQLTAGLVSPANYNSPEQIVIAGEVNAVLKASELCIDAGAKKVMPLAVSVPSHCELMRSAAEKLGQELNQTQLNAPNLPILHNVDVSSHSDEQTIKALLQQQLYLPVKWTQTMAAIQDMAVVNVVECGPGKVLSGLFKRFNRQLNLLPLNTVKGIDKFLEELI